MHSPYSDFASEQAMRIVKSLVLSVLPALLLASLLSSPSHAASTDRISGQLTTTGGQTVTLRGNIRHQAKPQFDQGPVDPAMHLGTMTLLTAPTAAQQKALTQLLAQQQDRKSPNYHKWLTPEQFADRFGLTQKDMQQLTAWLQSQGFTNIHPARARNWISFAGTALQVESAFSTEIHHYNVNGELHYANTTAPSIPAALSGIVYGIHGLDDFTLRSMSVRSLRPNYYSSALESQFIAPGDIYTIYDINPLLNATTPIDGTGQKVAIMGETQIYQSDINGFRTGFGMSAISCTAPTDIITACSDPHFSYVPVNGGPARVYSGDLSESDLDIEWSGAVAPGAQIIFVASDAPAFEGGNGNGVFGSLYYAIDNNLAPVISLSYGACEFGSNIGEAGVYPFAGAVLWETELKTANSEGITVVNSSGDTGAAACDFNGDGVPPDTSLSSTGLATQGLAVSYPASSPEVTAVGGTAIPLANFTSTYWGTTNAANGGTAISYIPEQAWDDGDEFLQFCQEGSNTFCQSGGTPLIAPWAPITTLATAQKDIGLGAGGGGASNCAVQNSDFSACVSGFPQPSWQTVAIAGQTTRMVPDVVFLATPNFPGYVFCTQLSELGGGVGSSCANGIAYAVGTNFSLIGGTSVSAPIFAGVVTLLNQYTGSTGQGNINTALYTLANAVPGTFHDVTASDNKIACQGGTPSGQPVPIPCPSTGTSAGIIGYSAGTGFDMATGLGSVDVNNLAVAMKDPPSFTLAPTAMTYQVTAGGTVNATVQVTLASGFSGTLTFACNDTAPLSICTAPPNANASGPVSFQISTTAPTAALRSPAGRSSGIFYAALLPGLFGILFTAGSRRRSLRGLRLLGLIAMLGFSTLWISSCGGGGSSGTSNPGTPVGNYNVTVSATSNGTTINAPVFIIEVVQ
jgi:subtilase family serine protease